MVFKNSKAFFERGLASFGIGDPIHKKKAWTTIGSGLIIWLKISSRLSL